MLGSLARVCLPITVDFMWLLPSFCSASYQNKENVDLSQVAKYAHHEKDVGSSEVQIARLTARVQQISSHLKENRKDHSSKRGLEAVLSQRKSLMRYLYRTNRSATANAGLHRMICCAC